MHPQLPSPAAPSNTTYWPTLRTSEWANALSDQLGNAGCALVVAATNQQAEQLHLALNFFLPKAQRSRLECFADYETLPYDVFSPSEEIISERLRVLQRCNRGDELILVVSLQSLMHRLPPTDYLAGQSFQFSTGDRLALEQLRSRLAQSGYLHVDTVREPGQLAIRGSLIDLYPMGAQYPCRLDLFDDEVESIRLFDPDSQLTLEKVEKIDILPGREFPLSPDAIRDFRNRWYQHFDSDPRQSPVYESVSRGFSPQGIESYLPLFFERTSSLLDYLPIDCPLYLARDLPDAAESFWHSIQQRHEQHAGNIERPLLPPVKVYLTAGELFNRFADFPRAQLDRRSQIANPFAPLPEKNDPLNAYRLVEDLTGQGLRILLVAESAGRREIMLETLAESGIRPETLPDWQSFSQGTSKIAICVGDAESGWICRDSQMALLCENDLFGQRVRQRQRREARNQSWADSEQIIRDLTELRPGSPVVHIEHGVGRYQGLEVLQVNNQPQEFLTLEYADKNRLYVPVHALDMIARYSGADGDSAPLNRLGSDQWEKAKRKAREKIRDTAAELLEIYAKRQAKPGNSYEPEEDDYLRFSQEFPFEETEDQLNAIAAVEADMAAARPMDRLVCGDVGFGKTEIAMRAAFIATSAGKQVAVLVPTTLLARQHAETFQDRFANWPIRIESLSRMRTEAQQKKTLQAWSDGKVDILIGTHKLLHADIETDRLGLMIVDEEHRFGVRQKERLKKLKAEVDILTLTATPIPRTLNMAMASIRDLSIIATPPARRLSIKTFVQQSENRVIQEAIQRELARGGQVYFVHNEIRTIEKRAAELQELLPQARIGIGHGQMREQELERVMADFYHQRFDILLCTTIIETGIDIPTANTIVIERADRFGLAQLHQLRGRVGRSHHQAYAFLLVPDKAAMTSDAVKRLEAIEEADHLGSGFTLATHDLEIRGAGELLGEDQSGQIHAIGFDLYQQMLERAVRQLQSGQIPLEDEDDAGLEINLGIPALIPDDYLPDINSRLQLYKRISAAGSEDALRELQVEMIDRFGLLPEQVKHLIELSRLKLAAKQCGIRKMDIGDGGGSVQFVENPPFDPVLLIQLVQEAPHQYRFSGPTRLQFSGSFESAEHRFRQLRQLLDRFRAPGN